MKQLLPDPSSDSIDLPNAPAYVVAPGPTSTNNTPFTPAWLKSRADRKIRGLFSRVNPVAPPTTAFKAKLPDPVRGEPLANNSWADASGKTTEPEERADPRIEAADYFVRRAAQANADAMAKYFPTDDPHTTFFTFNAASGLAQYNVIWPYGKIDSGRGFGHATVENYSNVVYYVYIGEAVSGVPYAVVPAAPSANANSLTIRTFPVRNDAQLLTLVPQGTGTGQVTVLLETVPRTASVSSFTGPSSAAAIAQAQTQPTGYAVVPAGAGTTTVKNSPGRVFTIQVTSGGSTAAATVQDGATVLFTVPSGAALGTIYTLNLPTTTNLNVVGAAGSASLLVSYS